MIFSAGDDSLQCNWATKSNWEIIVPPGYAPHFLKKFSAVLAKLPATFETLGNLIHHYLPEQAM